MQKLSSSWRNGFFLILIAIAGCNVFNPSGEGDAGNSSEGQLAEGEAQFRSLNFKGAMEAYKKAIDKDSTNAMGYYGYAKSVMQYYQINAASMLAQVQGVTGAQKSIPFIGETDGQLTYYLQAGSKVRKALSALTLRDTLTQWFNYAQNPNAKSTLKDPLSAKRIAFIKNYLADAEAGKLGNYKANQFPLSDFSISYSKIIADYGFVELMYAMSHIRDLDGNDTIDSRDDLMKKLTFGLDPSKGLKIDNFKDIQADLISNDTTRQNLNQLIQNVSAGVNSASTVINLLGISLPGSSDSGSDTLSNKQLTDKVSGNVDSVIGSLGSAITFYQFGDGKDNDGDGCIDEEILDGKDNDGDGFTDEDARVINPPLPDNVDNDNSGTKDLFDTDEALDPSFLLLFTKHTDFITGPKYKDQAFRIRIQADSLKPGIVLSTHLKAELDSAKAQVGGCWNNYK